VTPHEKQGFSPFPGAGVRATIGASHHEEESMDANGNGKVVVNLATGLEDPERVTVAFLVAGAAANAGKDVTMFLTKEAVRLAMPGVAEGVACDGCPPLPTLSTQFADAGGRLLVCPICFSARKLDEDALVGNAQMGGATPLMQWIGEGATVFSY
jgi:predicted peroxiredoxin